MQLTHDYWNKWSELSESVQAVWEHNSEYTVNSRDTPRLNFQDTHYLFVYDHMKHGFRGDKILSNHNGERAGIAWTATPFNFFKANPSGEADYPVPMLYGDRQKRAPILGEVWKVPVSLIKELDWYHDNHYQTQRLRIPLKVVVDPDKQTTQTLSVYTYLGLSSWWLTRTENLSPFDPITGHNGFRYHCFLKPQQNKIH